VSHFVIPGKAVNCKLPSHLSDHKDQLFGDREIGAPAKALRVDVPSALYPGLSEADSNGHSDLLEQ
jgi:hypothetical protein